MRRGVKDGPVKMFQDGDVNKVERSRNIKVNGPFRAGGGLFHAKTPVK